VVALYFPVAELLAYISQEMRMFRFHQPFSIKDVFLPSLLVALLYAAVAAVRKRIEPHGDLKERREMTASREVSV
jgi:hypothetical protein